MPASPAGLPSRSRPASHPPPPVARRMPATVDLGPILRKSADCQYPDSSLERDGERQGPTEGWAAFLERWPRPNRSARESCQIRIFVGRRFIRPLQTSCTAVRQRPHCAPSSFRSDRGFSAAIPCESDSRSWDATKGPEPRRPNQDSPLRRDALYYRFMHLNDPFGPMVFRPNLS